jgi:hypothetical protein
VITVDEVARVLRSTHFAFQDERELQDAIADVMAGAGASVEREVVLSNRERIDFMLPGGVGIEIKIKGSISEVTRQLHRYAQLPAIAGLVLVTTRMRLANLPDAMAGKPLRSVVILAGLG